MSTVLYVYGPEFEAGDDDAVYTVTVKEFDGIICELRLYADQQAMYKLGRGDSITYHEKNRFCPNPYDDTYAVAYVDSLTIIERRYNADN